MSTQKTVDNVGLISAHVAANRGQIARILPKAVQTMLSDTRFCASAMMEIRKSWHLSQCTKESIFGAMLDSARFGLEIGQAMGHAYLVPFKNSKTGQYEASFMLGYRGLCELARRSGQIKKIEAREVAENDTFDIEMGTTPKIVHKIPRTGRSSTVTHFYAIAYFTNGETQFDVMEVAEICAHRDKFSKAKDKEAWLNSFGEMAKKTVIRRLAKMLPLSAEFADAIKHEDEDYLEHKEIERQEEAPRLLEAAYQRSQGISAAESDRIIDTYTKVLTDAEALGLLVEGYPEPSTLPAHEALELTTTLRQEITEWKSKKESKT